MLVREQVQQMLKIQMVLGVVIWKNKKGAGCSQPVGNTL